MRCEKIGKINKIDGSLKGCQSVEIESRFFNNVLTFQMDSVHALKVTTIEVCVFYDDRRCFYV